MHYNIFVTGIFQKRKYFFDIDIFIYSKTQIKKRSKEKKIET